MATDIIRDIITRIQEGLMDSIGLPEQVVDLLTIVDRDIRREYGGERPYIAKTCEEDLANTAKRNNAIRRAWKSGEPVPVLMERHGLSRANIYRIVRGDM